MHQKHETFAVRRNQDFGEVTIEIEIQRYEVFGVFQNDPLICIFFHICVYDPTKNTHNTKSCVQVV